jgi:hypothetical protein
MPRIVLAVLGALALLLPPFSTSRAQRGIECAQCVEWNVPQRPFRLHGSTYYVGTHGLAAILITSPQGHVLIDGGLPQSAPLIRASIESLGFHMRDVKLILNSHAHYDHAGGIAELQRASGARVMASAWSAGVMRSGRSQPGDPQLTIAFGYPAVGNVGTFAFEDTLRVGPIQVVALVRRCALPRLRLCRQSDPGLGGRFPLHEEHRLPERDRRLRARLRHARAAIVRRARHTASLGVVAVGPRVAERRRDRRDVSPIVAHARATRRTRGAPWRRGWRRSAGQDE